MKTYFNSITKTLFAAAFLAAFVASCDDDPSSVEEGPGEEELITQVTLTLTELDGQGNPTQNTVTVEWTDEDGEGGNAPVIGTLILEAGKSYSGSIELLNTTETPAEDITEEVQEEADEHQFFYELSGPGADRVAVEYADTDSNGLPVGLSYVVIVADGNPTTATLNVVLSHFDDGPKNGTDKSDESDIDINIPVDIQ